MGCRPRGREWVSRNRPSKSTGEGKTSGISDDPTGSGWNGTHPGSNRGASFQSHKQGFERSSRANDAGGCPEVAADRASFVPFVRRTPISCRGRVVDDRCPMTPLPYTSFPRPQPRMNASVQPMPRPRDCRWRPYPLRTPPPADTPDLGSRTPFLLDHPTTVRPPCFDRGPGTFPARVGWGPPTCGGAISSPYLANPRHVAPRSYPNGSTWTRDVSARVGTDGKKAEQRDQKQGPKGGCGTRDGSPRVPSSGVPRMGTWAAESTTGATETPHSGRRVVGRTNQVSSLVKRLGLNNTAEGCIDRRSSCSWPNQRVRPPSRPSGQITRSVFRDTDRPQVTSSPCLSKRWTDPGPPVRHPVEIETDPVRWRPWEGTSQRSQARARPFEASTTLQARFSASGSNRQGNKRERNRHVGVFHATTWCHAGGTPPSGSCNTQDEDPTRELRRSVWAIGFEADENRPTPRTARRRVPCVWECAMETAARCASVP
eukprot:scaffold73_cov337-Pavlova_lutheri.AAC.41